MFKKFEGEKFPNSIFFTNKRLKNSRNEKLKPEAINIRRAGEWQVCKFAPLFLPSISSRQSIIHLKISEYISQQRGKFITNIFFWKPLECWLWRVFFSFAMPRVEFWGWLQEKGCRCWSLIRNFKFEKLIFRIYSRNTWNSGLLAFSLYFKGLRKIEIFCVFFQCCNFLCFGLKRQQLAGTSDW